MRRLRLFLTTSESVSDGPDFPHPRMSYWTDSDSAVGVLARNGWLPQFDWCQTIRCGLDFLCETK